MGRWIEPITVSAYERGYRRPDTETVARLAAIFGCTMDSLVGIPANIEVIPHGEPFAAPIVATVRAGFSAPILDDYEGEKLVDSQFMNGHLKNDYFWMRVKGDSMIGDRIGDGDLVLVIAQQDVESGSIALVAIDDETGTLKRVVKKPNTLILQPSNPIHYPEIFVGEEMNRVRVIGLVVEARQDLRKPRR